MKANYEFEVRLGTNSLTISGKNKPPSKPNSLGLNNGRVYKKPNIVCYEALLASAIQKAIPVVEWVSQDEAKLFGYEAQSNRLYPVNPYYTKVSVQLSTYLKVGWKQRCDVDNLLKAVLDGIEASGLIIDDNDVFEVSSRKEYGADFTHHEIIICSYTSK